MIKKASFADFEVSIAASEEAETGCCASPQKSIRREKSFLRDPRVHCAKAGQVTCVRSQQKSAHVQKAAGKSAHFHSNKKNLIAIRQNNV